MSSPVPALAADGAAIFLAHGYHRRPWDDPAQRPDRSLRLAARLLLLVSPGSALGLVIIGVGWLWTGCIVVIVLRGILGPLPAPVAASRSTRENRVSSLARLATWRDIGAGVGPRWSPAVCCPSCRRHCSTVSLRCCSRARRWPR